MTQPDAEKAMAIKSANQKKWEKKKTKKAAEKAAFVEAALNNPLLPAMVDRTVIAPLVSPIASTTKAKSEAATWDWTGEVHDMAAYEEKKRVEMANENWPWRKCPSKLVTQAPFAVNEFNAEKGYFTLTAAKQSSPLFNMASGLDHPILSILFQYYGTASKFAATCQAAFHMASQFIDHWDYSRTEYLCCDKDPKAGETVIDASVGKVVVVTPFRNRTCLPVHHDIQMYALQHLVMAFHNFADRFETLHLHRIPLLSLNLLSIVIPHMRNLKMLGIYQCELLHIGSTLCLLEILRSNRGAGKTSNIALDFFPRFHVGPACKDRSVYSGSFGVTWDDFHLDSRLAIWELVVKILPVAKAQGVDLVSKDAAFRNWLDRSPCWRVEDTLHTILTENNLAKVTCQVNFPSSKGRMSMTVENGHTAYPIFPKYICTGCIAPVAEIFFDFDEQMVSRMQGLNFVNGTPVAPYRMACLGCKLTRYLDCERDHGKLRKSRLVDQWLTKEDGSPNDDDLEYALRPDVLRNARAVADRYEAERAKQAAAEERLWEALGLTEKGWAVEERQREERRGPRAPGLTDKEPTSFW